jgi:hypothetical protein
MRKNLFGLVIVAAVLLAALSVAPASAADLAGNPAAVPALAAPGNCGAPAVALPGQMAKAETCTAAPTAESTVPSFMTPERRLGFCHCGCSSQRTCRTSDDCGGASCDQTISCC